MSFAIDVNILLYASDEASPLHAASIRFLARCVEAQEVFCIGWPTLMSYLRISTHPAIFTRPLSPDEATRNVESLLQLPHFRVLGEQEGFWESYLGAIQGLSPRGNLVPDAHLAALLHQHGIRVLYTTDRDFRKFHSLDARDPFAGSAEKP